MERFLNFEILNDDDCEEDYPEHCKHFECQPKYKRFLKRSYLSDCINEIYIINYCEELSVDTSVEEDKNVICQTLDTVLAPPKLPADVAAVQHVKKQLFRKSRKNSRKRTKPQHRVTSLTECFYPKNQRHLIGRYNVRRNYLKQEIPSMQDEEYRREAQVSEYLAVNESIQEIAQQLIGEVYRYRNNCNSNTYQKVIETIQELKEVQMEQYYRDRLLANEKLSEASVRSSTYLKVLMRLVIDYD